MASIVGEWFAKLAAKLEVKIDTWAAGRVVSHEAPKPTKWIPGVPPRGMVAETDPGKLAAWANGRVAIQDVPKPTNWVPGVPPRGMVAETDPGKLAAWAEARVALQPGTDPAQVHAWAQRRVALYEERFALTPATPLVALPKQALVETDPAKLAQFANGLVDHTRRMVRL